MHKDNHLPGYYSIFNIILKYMIFSADISKNSYKVYAVKKEIIWG